MFKKKIIYPPSVTGKVVALHLLDNNLNEVKHKQSVMALGPLHTEINSISVSTKSKGTSSAESTYQTDMR